MDTAATRAILCGLTSAAQATSMPTPEIKSSLASLATSVLFAKLREELAACAMSLGPAVAAERFGIREDFVIDAVKIYMDSEMKEGKYPNCVSDRFTQTYGAPLPTKIYQESGLQHGEPTKWERLSSSTKSETNPEDHNSHRSYTTVEKIKAVRAYTEAVNPRVYAKELGVPAINIIRWREKISTVCPGER